MAEMEMREFDKPEYIEPEIIIETPIDFPDVPLENKTTDQLNLELQNEEFVSEARKSLKLTKEIDTAVYKNLSSDADGYLRYKHKRISLKNGKGLSSIKTLLKNPDTREFLQKIGYESESVAQAPAETRDLETVAPEQTQLIKDKIRSFKTTEDWAKREKEKTLKQLSKTTTEQERKSLKEAVTYYDQLELQAKRRYNEVVDNQFKRVNEIINDKTRSLGERLKELFRRDGLTIGAIITALGMTISTIVLAILPNSPSIPSQNPKPPNVVQKVLLKLSNWLLDLAKKALSALPGILGSLVSFLFKKAGEAILFLSEHLIILLLALILFISEFIFSKMRNKLQK